MADIRLAKPAAGTTQTVPSAPDGRFIFDFPADAATLTRNGDDLVLTFEDGAAIQLQGFYTTYSKEEMPSFQVDGVEISGQDFFAALDEDLMPAAGPASGSSAARGGRYNEYGGSDLLDGIDHLGRLDIGFDGGTQLATDTVEPSPYSEVDHGVTVTPSGVGAATEVVTVYEAGLAGGSQAGEKDAPTMAGGSLSINAPDGVASIVIGGVVVFENGALTGKGVSTDEGTLSVTGYDPATGKLDFSYSLDRNTTEHVKSDPDTDTQISHTLVVTVTDTDGDSGSTTITVNVVDDAPTAVDDTVIGEEAQAQQGVVGDVLENDKTGADGLPNAVTSVKHGDEESMAGSALKGAYGELPLNADGTYTYKLDKNVDVEKGKSVTETFTYTITDADGDTSEATLTITIRGDEKEPVAPGEDKAEIVVDEGALSDGSGQHAEHGILGKDSFTVNLNGEDGTVTLKYGTGEDASTITLSLINDDMFDENWLSTNKTLTVNGVVVEVTDATQTEPGGPWKIEYTYKLTGQQAHKNGGSAGAVGADDALSDSINITVTDATGDMTTGSLMVTVHDDGPVLTDKIDFTVPKGKENYDDNSPEIMFTIGAQPYSIKLDDLTFGADVGDNDAPATLTVKVGEAEFTVMVTRDEDGNLHFSGDNGEGKILFTGPADADKEDSLSYDKETGIFTYTRPTADIGGTTNSYDVSLTITDADGDSDTVSDTYITVFRNPTVTDSTATTDEGNIIMNDIPIGSGDENDKTSQVENTAQGSITVNLDHADGTITIGDMPITVDKDGNILSVNGNTGGILDGQTIKGTYGYLSNISLVAQGDGTITINYTYTLNAPVNGGTNNVSGRGDSRLADQFTVTVTTQGGTETGRITANALDDAPVLAVSNPESVKDTADTIEIPLEKFSVGADVISLDGKTASISVEVGENEYTFTIIHESNGTYSFIAPNNQDDNLKIESTAEGGYKIVYTRAPQDIADGKDDSYTFDITVTDADGDTATGSVTVYAKVVPPTIDESGSTTDLLVDEDGLVHEPNSKTDAGQLVVDMHGQAGTVTIGGVQVTVSTEDQVGWAMEPAQGRYGKLTITEATWNDGKLTINYEYTLQTPYTDSDNENGINTVVDADSFQILINGESSGSITVDIVDDVPTLTVENFHGAYGEGIDGTVNFDFGADNGEGTKIELSVNGGEKVAGASTDGKNWTFDVDGQTVTLNAETGEFHYDLPASGSNREYTFQFTVTDADDDEVSNAAPVTVTVEGTDLTGVKGSVTGDDDNVLTGKEVAVTMPELPAGVTLVANQWVNVTDADGKVYGQLHVDENGKVTFEQTVAYSGSQHNAQGESEKATGFSGNLTVNLADGTTSSITVDVSILDDIPTISNSDMSTSVILGDSSANLAKVDETISFTKDENGNALTGTNVKTEWWNDTVHISATKVTYQGTDAWGNPLITTTNSTDMSLAYSSYNGGGDQSYAPGYGNGASARPAPETDWGLTVNGGEGGTWEIQENGNTSEAVVIDLDGYAYGITVNFGAFFSGGSNTGTGWDTKSEKALIAFYKDGQLVYSTVEEGTNSGKFTFNTGDIVLEGFDRVVVSAVDNGEDSDFTIQGFDFITKRDDPIIINEGKVTAKSGADGFADAYTDSYAKFDLADMVEQNGGELNGDGTSGTITVLMKGEKQKVTLELREGSSGESILTGTLADGEQLFTATLDKDGNWTMEQYDQFCVPGEGGQGSSNEFDLVFKTEDADGDIVSATVNVPLEVVDQTPATDTSIDNGNDTITITGGEGIAGTVAAGDAGGVDVQTTVQPGESYNISIMLDLSGSMKYDRETGEGNTASTNPEGSRMEMAVDALESFFQNSIQGHDGTVNIQLVGFGTKLWTGSDTLQITADMNDEQRQAVYDNFARILKNWQHEMFTKGGEGWDWVNRDHVYSQGTNYEAAMEKATAWFNDHAGNGGENLAFFISDGKPTYYNEQHNMWDYEWTSVEGTGSYSNKETVRQTLEAAQDLQHAGGGVKVNAIGIGTSESLKENPQTILNLIDNTGDSGQTVMWYPYQTHDDDDDWEYEEWSEYQPLVEGDSDLVNSKDDLTAALVGGSEITSTDLADAGSDEITAEKSASSVIVYGDVQNTDRLLYDLNQDANIQAALVAAGIGYGSGTEVFQWLEANADSAILQGTKYEGWTHTDSVDYMLQHAEELGYETLVSDDGTFYLADAHGDVLNMDGSEAGGVELADLTGRADGSDTITGSKADDVIYGQEGNDLLVGDAPSGSGEGSTAGSIEGTTVDSIKGMRADELDAFIQSVEGTDADGDDRLFGGTGNDVLLGMGGNDYLDGGAGEDAIFGGAGNDIIVYDSNDYLVSGGSGIDFMVSGDETLTLNGLLGGKGDGTPIVKGIEVLLKGEDALSLTSIQELADKYGIKLDTNPDGQETLTLDMSKWTEQQDGSYGFTGGADLTLETNLEHDSGASSESDGEMAQQVFILQNSNS